ncbi:hypothetical protein RKD49_004174 [Streptomyces glaucescens]
MRRQFDFGHDPCHSAIMKIGDHEKCKISELGPKVTVSGDAAPIYAAPGSG